MNRLFLLLFGMVTFVAHAQVPNYVPTEGLVAWYPLDGDAVDASASNEAGELYGAYESENRFDEPNMALQFEGELSFVDLGMENLLSLSEDDTISIAFWAMAEGYGAPITKYQHLDYGSSWFVEYSPTYGYRMWGDGTSGTPNPSEWNSQCPNNPLAWTQVVVVFAGASGVLWLNGELICESDFPVSSLSQEQPVLLGRSNCTAGSNCNQFNGRLDDLGLWNRALTEEEILALYNAPSPAPGCTDTTACNYNEEANEDDGTCTYPPFGLADCEAGGALCGEGTIWDASLQACVGFNDCPSDLDGDGLIGVEDLLSLLSDFGTDCVASDGPESAEWTCGDPVSYHGYDYATVQIGEQCWFAENLRSELYQNGLPIPGGLDNEQWSTTSVGAQSIGPIESNPLTHGRLYNGYALLSANGICPNGWGVPADEDWITLETHIGMTYGFYDYGWRGNQLIGYDLKASANDIPQWNGTNLYGFSATAGGYRNSDGETGGGWSYGYWWSSSETANNIIWRGLYSASGNIGRNEQEKNFGYSVRCIKD